MSGRVRGLAGGLGADRLVLGLAAALIVVGAVAADDQVTETTRALDGWAAVLLMIGGLRSWWVGGGLPPGRWRCWC